MKEATNSCVVLFANYCLHTWNERQGTIDSRNFFTLGLAYQITRYPSNNLQLQSLRIWFLRVTYEPRVLIIRLIATLLLGVVERSRDENRSNDSKA